MTTCLDLMKRCSWRAEKHFKANGHFRTVLWAIQYDSDNRDHTVWIETGCTAPVEASDNEIFDALTEIMGAALAGSGATAFALAYHAKAIDVATYTSRQTVRKMREIIGIEAHSAVEHL